MRSRIFCLARSSRLGAMSVPDMLGERSRAITSGAVSVTKGEGAARQAGPAAAMVISMAAPITRSGA